MTQWKDVPGHAGYEVSSDGRVRRKAYELKPHPLKDTDHLYVTLGGRKRMYVHRLVAMAFLDNTGRKPVVNHKNGSPSDNRVDNLEWATYGENIAHGYRSNGRVHYSNVRVSSVSLDGEIVGTFPSMRAAGDAFHVTPSAIRSAVLRKGMCCVLYWRRA